MVEFHTKCLLTSLVLGVHWIRNVDRLHTEFRKILDIIRERGKMETFFWTGKRNILRDVSPTLTRIGISQEMTQADWKIKGYSTFNPDVRTNLNPTH